MSCGGILNTDSDLTSINIKSDEGIIARVECEGGCVLSRRRRGNTNINRGQLRRLAREHNRVRREFLGVHTVVVSRRRLDGAGISIGSEEFGLLPPHFLRDGVASRVDIVSLAKRLTKSRLNGRIIGLS